MERLEKLFSSIHCGRDERLAYQSTDRTLAEEAKKIAIEFAEHLQMYRTFLGWDSKLIEEEFKDFIENYYNKI